MSEPTNEKGDGKDGKAESPLPTETDMRRMHEARIAEERLLELASFDWKRFLRRQAIFAAVGSLFFSAISATAAGIYLPDRILSAALVGTLYGPAYFILFVGMIACVRFLQIRMAVRDYCRIRNIPPEEREAFIRQTKTPRI